MTLTRRRTYFATPEKLRAFARCPAQYERTFGARTKNARAEQSVQAAHVALLVDSAIRIVSVAHAGTKTTVAPEELLAALEGYELRQEGRQARLDLAAFARAREILKIVAGTLDLSRIKIESGRPLLNDPWVLLLPKDIGAEGFFERVDELEDGSLAILEHTTDNDVMTRDELRLDPGAIVTLAAAHGRWPEKRVKLVRRYVARGATVELEWTNELDSWAHAIVRGHYGALAMDARPEKTGAHCTSCPLRASCVSYERKIDRGDLPDLDQEADVELFVWRLARAKRLQKLVKTRLKDLTELARSRLSDGGTIVACGQRVQIAKRRVPRFPDWKLAVSRLAEVTGMDREDLERRIVGIKKDALGQVVASLPEEVRKRAIAEIEKTATQDVATWVEVRPLREPFVAPAAEPTTLARASAEP